MSLLHAAPKVFPERNVSRDLLEIFVRFDLVFDSLAQKNETTAIRIGKRTCPGLRRFRFDSGSFRISTVNSAHRIRGTVNVAGCAHVRPTHEGVLLLLRLAQLPRFFLRLASRARDFLISHFRNRDRLALTALVFVIEANEDVEPAIARACLSLEVPQDDTRLSRQRRNSIARVREVECVRSVNSLKFLGETPRSAPFGELRRVPIKLLILPDKLTSTRFVPNRARDHFRCRDHFDAVEFIADPAVEFGISPEPFQRIGLLEFGLSEFPRTVPPPLHRSRDLLRGSALPLPVRYDVLERELGRCLCQWSRGHS